MSNWTANDIPKQAGRTFVITGANSGLGYIMSLELARRGAHVIMTARNEARGRAAVARIPSAIPDASLDLRLLDLADLDDVKVFAARLIAEDTPIDCLSIVPAS
jgi:NAD(P)-dependent dehydrogenase (short-subunit alcohol dehydrogenase family)